MPGNGFAPRRREADCGAWVFASKRFIDGDEAGLLQLAQMARKIAFRQAQERVQEPEIR